MRILFIGFVGLLFPFGIFLAAGVSLAWEDYRKYTQPAVGVVSERTPTYAAIRLRGGNLEWPYGLLSGTGRNTPPARGPRLNVGDQMDLLHPPGLPERARLKDGLAPPRAPEWLRWVGFGLAGLAVVLLVGAVAFLAEGAAVGRPSAFLFAASPRARVGSLFVLIVAGLLVGLRAFGPYFLAEQRRLLWWEGLLLWLGSGTALFWFTIYFARHFILGVPVAPPAGSARRPGTLFWVATVSIVGSMATNLVVTIRLHQAEWQAFGTAQRTGGTIEAVSKTYQAGSNHFEYVLHCWFVDGRRQMHAADFLVNDRGSVCRLAPAATRAVRMECLPAPVTIAYDAERPARCWLADLGWPNIGSSLFQLYFISILMLPLQIMVTLMFLFALVQARRSTGALPWWYDLHGVVLIAVEAGFVGGAGALVLFFEWLGALIH